MIETHCLSAAALNHVKETEDKDISEYTVKNWRREQEKDQLTGPWMSCVNANRKPTYQQIKGSPENAMLRHFEHLRIKRGALYKENNVDGEQQSQMVLPYSFRKEALRGLHDDVGHPGRDRTLALARERFWWPGMAKDIEEWVKHCPRCLRRKSTGHTAPLVNIVTYQHTTYTT